MARTPAEWEERKKRFCELYVGRLILFESTETKLAMQALGDQLDGTAFEGRGELHDKVLDVSYSLRNFLERRNDNDWRITFDTLVARQN